MTDSTALATRSEPDIAHLPVTLDQYEVLKAQARHLLESGFCPKGITTPQQVLYICLKGRELGFTDVYALSNIVIINGKPTLSAEAMLRLVYEKVGGNAIRVRESSSERCMVEYRRPEWDSADRIVWTREDAQAAGLTSDAWKKYPATMLRWRAISGACKVGFPDVIGGVYTPEEMGAEVRIDAAGEPFIDSAQLARLESGEVIDAEPVTRSGPSDPERATLLKDVMGLIAEAAGIHSIEAEDMERQVRANTHIEGVVSGASMEHLEEARDYLAELIGRAQD